MKIVIGIVAALVVVVAIWALVQYRGIQRAADCTAKEVTSGRMTKTGDTWHIDFTSRFDAPVDKVFDAFGHPEQAVQYVPENVMKSEVVKEDGNTKVVDVIGRLDILPPGFKVQNLRTEYTVFPAEHRITSRSIDFKLADIDSTYRFEPSPDGKGTLLKFTQTSKDKAPLIVESLQKGALRETYATQIRAVNRALGLAKPEEKRAEG